MFSEDPVYIWAKVQNQSITVHQPHQEKGMKSGHLLVDKEAREDPVKGQRVPVRAPQWGDQRGPAAPKRRAPYPPSDQRGPAAPKRRDPPPTI